MRILNKILFTLTVALLGACSSGNSDFVRTSSEGSVSTGQGGSLARFALYGDYLYTVDIEDLTTFNVSDPKNPVSLGSESVDFGIETIFADPVRKKLFLGSQTGVYVYNLEGSPSSPNYVSVYRHVRSCDPVVVDSQFAYVTLNNIESGCQRGVNILEVLNVSDLRQIYQEREYQMEGPQGLGIDGNFLFVCDNGLKVYNKSNAPDLQYIRKYEIPAVDVIPYNGNLIVTAEDGIYQYAYVSPNQDLEFLSKIAISKE